MFILKLDRQINAKSDELVQNLRNQQYFIITVIDIDYC